MGQFFSINITELGLFFVGLAYVLTYYFKGGNTATADVIVALKEQHELNVNRISELVKQIGELRGQLEEKDKRMALLESIVKLSPEQETYMVDMRKFTDNVAKYMENSTKTLGEVSVFMHNLNTK